MKVSNVIKGLAVATSTALLFACGGGGSSTPTTTVNGVAQAGIFSSGQAVFKGYSGAAKNKEYTLTKSDGTTPITAPFVAADKGKFSANIGTYSGPLKICVSGTYKDEATNTDVTIPPTAPLKAVIPASSVSGSTTVPVTPLTEISANKIDAAIKASASASAANDLISQNNKGVAQLFGLTDVTATVPVAPNAADLTASTTKTDQAAYTVALVKLSQYVKQYADSTSGLTAETAVSQALNQISTGIVITPGAGTAAPQVKLNDPVVTQSLATVIATPVQIPASSTDSTATPLPAGAANTVGSAITTVKTSSNITVQKYAVNLTADTQTSVYGVQIDVTVPEGVTLSVGSNNSTAVGTVVSSVSGVVVYGTLSNGTLKLTFAGGRATTLNTTASQIATILSSVTGTAPGTLAVSALTWFDQDGGKHTTGVTATVSAL